MADPRLMILDEPCSGLDLYAREELLNTLEEMMGSSGPTVIYVSHHLEEIIPPVTHAVLLKEGSITASGKKEEVLTEKNLEQVFQVPLHITWENGRPWVRIRRTN